MSVPSILRGLAYICTMEGCTGLTGRLITESRQQYSLVGKPHHHYNHDDDHPDHHTCCYDDTVEILDLVLSHLTGLSEDLIFSHVIKSGEDNFSLISDAVTFYTDKLFVGEKAEEAIVKYFSSDLCGRESSVCVGEMNLKVVQKHI